VWSSAAPRGVPALDLGGADLRLRSGAEARCDSCHAEPLPRLASRVARLATTPSPWPSPKYTRYCHHWSASASLPPRKPAGPFSDDRSAGGTLTESADLPKSYFQAADPDNLAPVDGLEVYAPARGCARGILIRRRRGPDCRLTRRASSVSSVWAISAYAWLHASRVPAINSWSSLRTLLSWSNSPGRCAASRFGESRSASRPGLWEADAQLWEGFRPELCPSCGSPNVTTLRGVADGADRVRSDIR